jgi:Na+/glutamate symporter
MELLAVLMAGFFAPIVVQYVRRVSGKTGLKDTTAQAIVLGVSLTLALAVALIEGKLTTDGDLGANVTVIFTVATLVYKKFQEQFDAMLPAKAA